MKKKVMAVVIASIMASSMLAGCGSSNSGETGTGSEVSDEAEGAAEEAGNAEAASGDPVTITFMHDWPEHEAAFTKIVEDFEAANPNIKVETQVITWDVLTQTLTTDFAAGEAPDVACCWSSQMGSFNALGGVYDLTPYMDANDGEWRNSLLTSAVQVGTVNDQVFCVPFRTTSTVLAYNKTMMEENGWEVPKNVDEMEALMDKVKEKDIKPLIVPGTPGGYHFDTVAQTFALYNLYDSGQLTTPEYLSGRDPKVSDAFTKAGTKLRDWMDKGYIDATGLSMTREDASGQFYQQKGLFVFMNNNELGDMEKNAKEAGFEIGVMGFPAPEGHPQLLFNFGADSFMVYSGTEHPDEAVKFLQYITSEEVQQEFGNSTGSVMANKNCSYENENQATFSKIFSESESYRINYDYNAGDVGGDVAKVTSNFVADPSVTPEEYGQQVEETFTKCLEENG